MRDGFAERRWWAIKRRWMERLLFRGGGGRRFRTPQQLSERCLGLLGLALSLNNGGCHLCGRLFGFGARLAAGVLQILETRLRSAQHPSHALHSQKGNAQRDQTEKKQMD